MGSEKHICKPHPTPPPQFHTFAPFAEHVKAFAEFQTVFPTPLAPSCPSLAVFWASGCVISSHSKPVSLLISFKFQEVSEVSVVSLRSHLIKTNPSRNMLDSEESCSELISWGKFPVHLGDPDPPLSLSPRLQTAATASRDQMPVILHSSERT